MIKVINANKLILKEQFWFYIRGWAQVSISSQPQIPFEIKYVNKKQESTRGLKEDTFRKFQIWGNFYMIVNKWYDILGKKAKETTFNKPKICRFTVLMAVNIELVYS